MLGRWTWSILYHSEGGFVCVVGVPPPFGCLHCRSAIGMVMPISIRLCSPCLSLVGQPCGDLPSIVQAKTIRSGNMEIVHALRQHPAGRAHADDSSSQPYLVVSSLLYCTKDRHPSSSGSVYWEAPSARILWIHVF